MKLEFHQLDRRYEHLRARRPEQQRRLMASLAASGQQTPIIVVAHSDQPDRYLVIDGYKRIAALQQLARDLVEQVAQAARVEGRRGADVDFVNAVAQRAGRRFDKGGENFYDQISALHKSVRGKGVAIDGATQQCK